MGVPVFGRLAMLEVVVRACFWGDTAACVVHALGLQSAQSFVFGVIL